MEFSGNVIRGIPTRDDYIKPEFYGPDNGIWMVKDSFKGDRNKRVDWYTIATFHTKEELMAWAESYYSLHPFCTGADGPKANPKPYWTDEGCSRAYLRGLHRHLTPGAVGRTYYPEFRKDSSTGRITVWDIVKNGEEVSSYMVSEHHDMEAAKIWAAGHYGFGAKSGLVNKYVPPIPALKEAEKKLLLLV